MYNALCFIEVDITELSRSLKPTTWRWEGFLQAILVLRLSVRLSRGDRDGTQRVSVLGTAGKTIYVLFMLSAGMSDILIHIAVFRMLPVRESRIVTLQANEILFLIQEFSTSHLRSKHHHMWWTIVWLFFFWLLSQPHRYMYNISDPGGSYPFIFRISPNPLLQYLKLHRSHLGQIAWG